MKVLIVGDWYSDIYEKAIYTGFLKLGYEVDKFSWIQYFKYYQYPTLRESKGNIISSIYYRTQNKYTFGPVISTINKDLVKKVTGSKYDLVFIYRGTHILPNTINKIKKTNAKVFGYNNDDPFSISYNRFFWRNYKNAIMNYDHIFSYRHKNITDYHNIGYKNTTLLRSYYITERNFSIEKEKISSENLCDVIFIGHYEDDGRDKLILDILNAGINLKVYGTNWDESRIFNEIEQKCGKIVPAYDNYNLLLNGSKIALILLSKKNNDTYTRRVFEIAVTSSAMLSEYTGDLNEIFESDKEISFFENNNECLNKINQLLSGETYREKISKAAYDKTMKIGHEVSDRVKEIIKVYESFN